MVVWFEIGFSGLTIYNKYGSGNKRKLAQILIDSNLFNGEKVSFSPSLLQPILDKNISDILWIERRIGTSLKENIQSKVEDIGTESDIYTCALMQFDTIQSSKNTNTQKNIPNLINILDLFLPKETRMICNICDNDSFTTGPSKRLSSNGQNPRCTKCGSLERHRALRTFYDTIIKTDDYKSKAILQISEDKVLDTTYFSDIEVSIYGKKNSIDIQNIEKKSDTYDIVVCNHVLEHVQEDLNAMKELVRVTTNHGFTQLAVPNPLKRKKTIDWGYPDDTKHGHYREYGKDFIDMLIETLNEVYPLLYIAEIRLSDPVTKVPDVLYIISRNESFSISLLKLFKHISLTKLHS